MPAPVETSVEAALDRAGLEYRAADAQASKPTQKAVDELNGAASAAAIDPSSITNEQLAGLVVGLAVLFLPKLDKRLKYSEAEQEQIARAAVPVLNKYFPDGGLPCEAVLLATVAIITAPKFMSAGGEASEAGGAKAASSAEPASQEAA